LRLIKLWIQVFLPQLTLINNIHESDGVATLGLTCLQQWRRLPGIKLRFLRRPAHRRVSLCSLRYRMTSYLW